MHDNDILLHTYRHHSDRLIVGHTRLVPAPDSLSTNMVLQAIKYSPTGPSSATLEVLDQLALPHRSVYLPITSCEDAWDAIKQMKVRGAPAIAIVAALSLAVELHNKRTDKDENTPARSVREYIWERLEYLKTSRSTAVNLGDAVGKLKSVAAKAEEIEGSDGRTVTNSYIAAAERMLIDDVNDNEAIGKHGAIWIKEHTKAGMRIGEADGDLKVITHCNTGSVGCGGIFELAADHLLPDHLRRLAMAQHWV
jgi:methylthioribose-1-phosphate isomerase